MKNSTALRLLDQREVLGKEFKVYGTWKEPLFLAKDVADWIEYEGRTGQLLAVVNDDEKLTHTIYASGQNREMWFLTEEGLYEVLMQSRKPIAKEFKAQVKEILKSIRLLGYYARPEVVYTPEFIIQIGTQMKELTEERDSLAKQVTVLEKELDTSNGELNYLENVVTEYEPKVDYYEKILTSHCPMTTTQIAADYNLTAQKLNKILNEEKVQRKVNGQWVLYAKYLDRDYTRSNTTAGGTRAIVQTKRTQRGRLLIHQILEGRGVYAQASTPFSSKVIDFSTEVAQ